MIAGHGRLLAARKLGMLEVPTLELSQLTAAQRRAYVLADNRLALSAGWDQDLLRIELGELQADGFDLAPDRLRPGRDRELSGRSHHRPDRPRRRARGAGGAGQQGGRCPGCWAATAWPAATAPTPRWSAAALAGVRPHLMVTDPPYGVEYDPAWRNRAGLGSTRRVGKGGERTTVPTGARPGRCSPAMSRMSGMGRCTRRRWPGAWRRAASRSGRRSSGPRSAWCSGGGTITGSTSRPGMR